jgi:broad specificity phosphatase PhoE
MPVEIYFVRHGQTEWNKAGKVQGRLDSPLTETGRAHAVSSARILTRAVAERGGELTFYASPQGRALETATIIQQHCGLPAPIIDHRLREMSFGSWEGLCRHEIEARWPTLNWETRACPDGETYDEARERMTHWLSELQPGVIVAVSHGMTSRVLRGVVLGLSRDEAYTLPVPQGIVWRLHRGNVDVLET